ncbi:regulator RcnB of Ni and Co efflux [Sphingomonas sp. YR710]|uniref:RcnB family protein n=1 Tax=Sphingomonas sp. YR710 TaxID=1882773 RepID=UPI00087FBDC1|nr:RcnB family protein [Sphingomonas sp. YR710]SDD29741.1 regulator RcnB of Ni and Co efflux [Sphingomonas sp. YR710]
MKKFIIATLAATVVATPVLAAPNQGQNDNGRYEQNRGDQGGRGDRNDRGQIDQRHDDHRNERGNSDRRDYRGAYGHQVQHRNWARGERFDYRYAPNYRVIYNPGQYRLHAAPRGYRWVQSGNDAVLIGLTSGLIATVLVNSIH